MQRFLNLYNAVRRGPHGAAIAAGAAGSTLAVLGLAVALIDRRAWVPAVALTLAALIVDVMLAAIIISRLRAKINDVHAAISLEAGLRRVGWTVTDFFTDGAAANPSLQLFNLKVLQFVKPRTILELGSGQTTKLLSAYARAAPAIYVLTLEQDASWADRLRPDVVHDYRHVPLVSRAFSCPGSGLQVRTQWYDEVPELRGRRFDYILIDGPDSGAHPARTRYARSGILEYMPSILNDSFVVVFDDAERYGETMTVDALRDILKALQIRHVSFSIHGIKTQVVFCSPDHAYLRSA